MTRAMTIAESLFFIFFTPHFQTINLRCETGSVAGAVTSLSSDHHKDESSAAPSGRQRPTGAAIQDSLPPRQRRLLRKSFRSGRDSSVLRVSPPAPRGYHHPPGTGTAGTVPALRASSLPSRPVC